MNKSKQDKIAGNKYNFSGKNVYIGLDVHKKSYQLTACCEGMIIKRCRIPASPESLVKFIREKFVGAKIFSAYEAGFCGFHLHRYLVKSGIDNIVVNPASIEVRARDRVKTDKRDASKIAVQLEAGRLKCVNIPSIQQESRREISRLRETLARKKREVGCQISSLIDRHQELGWEKHSRISRKFIDDLLTLHLPDEIKCVVKTFANLWISLSDQIKKVEEKLKEQAKEDAFQHEIIQSTPGIGLLGARIIANEIGDMSQFTNVKNLYSFTGLTPSEHSSGNTKRQGHITRQGRSILRKILVQSSWVAIRCDENLRLKYESIARRSSAKKAIVAIARILIGKIRACLLAKEKYLVMKPAI